MSTDRENKLMTQQLQVKSPQPVTAGTDATESSRAAQFAITPVQREETGFHFGITITPEAHAQARKRLVDYDKSSGRSASTTQGGQGVVRAEATSVMLRLGVKGGGCAGYAYVIDVTHKVRAGRDEVFDLEGLRVVVDTKSMEVLRGATLAWETHLMSYGFRFKHPRAADACGCGTSFDLK